MGLPILSRLSDLSKIPGIAVAAFGRNPQPGCLGTLQYDVNTPSSEHRTGPPVGASEDATFRVSGFRGVNRDVDVSWQQVFFTRKQVRCIQGL